MLLYIQAARLHLVFGCTTSHTNAGVALATEKCRKSGGEKEQIGGCAAARQEDKRQEDEQEGVSGVRCRGLMAATDTSRKAVWRRWSLVVIAVELVHSSCNNQTIHIRTNRGP